MNSERKRQVIPDSAREQSGEVERIELRLTELKQMFNSFDASPFRKRDLNAEAAEFIIDWAREIPKAKRIMLVLHLIRRESGQEREIARGAVRAYFAARANSTRLSLRQLFRMGRTSLAIGLVFLAVCLGLSEYTEPAFIGSGFGTLLRESLVIGGWVAMWRPIEIFLYDWWPLHAEVRVFERLSAMPVEIVEEELDAA